MKHFMTAASSLAAALLAALPAAAEPSTCWSSDHLADNGKMQGYACDVTLVRGRNPYWLINHTIKVDTQFKEYRATIQFDGETYTVPMDLDDELDIRLDLGDNSQLVFSPTRAFKTAVRGSLNNTNARQQRPSSRYADTIERTLFD